MKLFKFFFIVVILLLIGGFGYVAFTDVPVPQSQVTKTIPNEQIFQNQDRNAEQP